MITLNPGENVICGVFTQLAHCDGREGLQYDFTKAHRHGDPSGDPLLASFVIPDSVSQIFECARRAQKSFNEIAALQYMYCKNDMNEGRLLSTVMTQQNTFAKECSVHQYAVMTEMKASNLRGAPGCNNLSVPRLLRALKAKEEWLPTYLANNYNALAIMGNNESSFFPCDGKRDDWGLRVAQDTVCNVKPYAKEDPRTAWAALIRDLAPFVANSGFYRGMEKYANGAVRGFIEVHIGHYIKDTDISRVDIDEVFSVVQTQRDYSEQIVNFTKRIQRKGQWRPQRRLQKHRK